MVTRPNFHPYTCALAWVLLSSTSALSQETAQPNNTLVGVWQLHSDWGKGEEGKGVHILTVKPDHSGTIKDLKKGGDSKIRDLKIQGNEVSFRYFFSQKREYEIQFSGELAKGKLTGNFSIFGAQGKVVGTPITGARVKSLPARVDALETFQARRFTSAEGETLQYRLFIPQDYDADKKYPIVLFHHGGGGAGSDNRRNLEGACVHEWIQPAIQAKHPCFIVAPQIPGKDAKTSKSIKAGIAVMRLRIRAIHEILDQLEQEFSLDTNREYVTGLSFGGECTWLSLLERPNRFAAAVPICAGNTLFEISIQERGRKFAKFPLWIFHGDADRVISVEFSRNVVNAIKQAGGKPNYTEYAGVGHYSWDKAYRDPQLIAWLFSQSRADN